MTSRGVWLGLGANTGDRVGNLRVGLEALIAGGVDIYTTSAIYDTPLWGSPPSTESQPRFANIAVAGRCVLTAHELLALCKQAEAAAGRDFEAPHIGEHTREIAARVLGSADVDRLIAEGVLVQSPDGAEAVAAQA